MSKHGIRVIYDGCEMQFTECKYVAFCKLLRWDYQFQPHEMNWYLPDLLVRYDGLLHYIDVKGGAANRAQLERESQKLFTNSQGYEGRKTLVGTDPTIYLGDPLPLPDAWRELWNEAVGIADECRRQKYKSPRPINQITSLVGSVELVELKKPANQKTSTPITSFNSRPAF